MKSFLFSISFTLATTYTFGQTVTDHANNGQMKRMVFEQWDDWKPTPETGFLGFPKNLKGFLYWRVLHNSYYNGPDKRPYRAGGTFEQNYTSLALQEQDDQQIRDSMQKVMETSVATYVNMSGGAADVAWSMYFGKQFNQLLKEIPIRQLSIANKYPVAANKMSANRHYKEYLEYLDLTKDRLNAIHNSFIDKGDRILTYLEIQKDLKHHNQVMNNMINDYIRITKLPTTNEVQAAKKKTTIYTDDAQIVKHILVTFNF